MIIVATLAHEILTEIHLLDSVTVDMTCGRGNDTLFLSRISKKVIAFDIQKEAIDSTRALLQEHQRDNVELVLSSHSEALSYLPKQIGAVIYTLGYLPHGSKEIMTHPETTIKSLEDTLPLLMDGGICVIVVYQKHDGNEAMAVKHYCSNLPSKEYDVLKLSVLNKELSPYIIKIQKKKNSDS